MIILIDHDFRFFGASIYLKYLYKELIKSFNVLYFIPKNPLINPSIPFIIYENQLINLINQNNPKIIYINSLNKEIIENWNHLKNYKTIFHSHEYFCEFIKPDFVVSELIASFYVDKVKIQKPFIPLYKLNQIYNYKNSINLYKDDKITIGMCGEISERKNFSLFSLLYKIFPNYNFVWIGGDKDEKTSNNFIIIKYTREPHIYFNSIDYLLFTGTNDPCPYVILENIILETPILLFKNSIMTPINSNLIFYLDSDLNIKSIIKSIYMFVKKKKNNNDSNNGYKYIKNHFTNIDNIINYLDSFYNK